MAKNKAKMNKFVTGVATAAMVATAVVPAASAAGFTDISTLDNNVKAEINKAVDLGFFKDGATFNPSVKITRGQAALTLARYIAGESTVQEYVTLNELEDTVTPFNDVPVSYKSGADFQQELYYASLVVKHAGAFTQNNLNPTGNVTRTQMAKIITETFGLEKVAGYGSTITDIDHLDVGTKGYIETIASHEITNVTKFMPAGHVTRSQMASFLVRSYDTVQIEDDLEISIIKPTEDITVMLGDEVTLPETVEVVYNDQTTANIAVEWDTGNIDFTVAGTFDFTGTIAGTDLTASVKVIVEEVDASVQSVKALNGKTVEIKFTQPVKKSTIVTNTGKLVAGSVSFNSLETPPNNINVAAADAELSADGKTVTITTGGVQLFEGRYRIVVDNVQTTTSNALPKYDQVIDLGKDTTSPAVASVEKVNASTSKVHFTEAIANLSNSTQVSYSFKRADGTNVPNADVTIAPATDGKSLTVSASATTYAGEVISATILGAKDYAGNLINPNPTTFNFQIGVKDGVAPTIASTKAISPTQIEVNFSEEVQGFATTNAAQADSRVKLTGASGQISATVKAKEIQQDAIDKKKYIVTLDGSALDGTTQSAVADLKIIKTGITDLSGEDFKNDYMSIITFEKDTDAPQHVSTKVVTEANQQWLVLEFDEKLDPTVATVPTGVVVNTTNQAKAVKNFVTDSGVFAFGALTGEVELTADEKGIKVLLSKATFSGNALIDGTTYTFDLNAKDVAGNTSSATEVSFTYNENASAAKPALVTPVVIIGTGQDTLVLEFDKAVDGSSATNLSNYTVAGVPVTNAVLSPVTAGGTQKVTLTLGENTQSGDRSITVSGVKSTAGVTMDPYNGVVTLKENVKPTVTAAKVLTTKTIELTFSENVTLTGTTNFDVFLDGSTTAESGVSTVAGMTTDKKVVITLTNSLTAANLANTILVKPATGIDVKDAAGNPLSFSSIVATQ